jgi:hypothetical protein
MSENWQLKKEEYRRWPGNEPIHSASIALKIIKKFE